MMALRALQAPCCILRYRSRRHLPAAYCKHQPLQICFAMDLKCINQHMKGMREDIRQFPVMLQFILESRKLRNNRLSFRNLL